MTQEKRKKENHETGETIAAILEDVAEKGKALLNDGFAEARDMYDEKKAFIKEKADEMKDKKVGEIAKEVQRFVKANPWTSIALAVGMGFILGSILKSDDK